jgi:hypothetical protein
LNGQPHIRGDAPADLAHVANHIGPSNYDKAFAAQPSKGAEVPFEKALRAKLYKLLITQGPETVGSTGG